MEQDINQDVNNDNKMRKYIIYSIIFVSILIIIGISSSYAYFKISEDSTSSFTLKANAGCFGVTYAETTDTGLDINYPIKDDKAKTQVKPVKVTITNTCTQNGDTTYKLVLTTLQNGTTDQYIGLDKMRYLLKKNANSGSSTEDKVDYLNTLKQLGKEKDGQNDTKVQELVKAKLDSNTVLKAYTTKTSYVLASGTLKSNEKIDYELRLWIDYYEGDKAAYSSSTHTSSYDNSTKNKSFKYVLSLIANYD